jgi:hypothetical protein
MRITRPTPEAQKKVIEDIFFSKAQGIAGDTWYIISKKWFQEYENYVQELGDPPGPIDNQPLITGEDTLRAGAEENR